MQATDEKLERIARRVKWWEPADNTLNHRDDFLCRVMALGLWDDVLYTQGVFGLEAFRQALAACPPGVMDPASWNFWHLRLGSVAVPPLPERTFA